MILTIYTQPGCTSCEQAKNLMKSKGIQYQEITLNVGQPQVEGKTYIPVQSFKEKFPNARTVPQITEGNTHIGDYNDLVKFLRFDKVK